MRTTSGELLEFEALRSLLGRYVTSPLGGEALDLVAPSTDRVLIEEELAATGEAIEYLRTASQPQRPVRGAAVRLRFDSMPDTAASARKLAVEGAALEGHEILELSGLLDRASDARTSLSAVSERFPRLAKRAEAIAEFRPLLSDLAGKILPDGSVADHASVALGRMRREIERQRRLIQESLERFLRKHREEGILQEEFVTIRNERFVIPLIAGQKRKVQGIIHGASGTGHTLFVEPLETIDLNNELVRLTEEELREVHRILRELTERLREYSPAIATTLQVMSELELLFAKAQFGVDFDCVIPRFSADERRRLHLEKARHPLLEDVLRKQSKRVVPVSIELDGLHRTLLISGPNTGGKTVTMKTVGLLSLMAQSSIPVPAAAAEFPIFDQVLADMGDNQSIQESLSTFSAHIARVRSMIEDATPDSLVLLDELGRATDPEEGGALGTAVLERFHTSGAFTIASTHLMALKAYGASAEGVLNASMGFDEETLQPTYVLRIGAPGKSAGLEIASRLGLPAGLIEQARGRMSTGERDIARFLADLHERLTENVTLGESLRQERESLARREKALEREWQARESAKLKEIERRSELLMEKFEQQAKETIDRLTETGAQRKAAENARRQVAKTRREFERELETTVLATEDESRQGALERPKIEEGARVRLKGVREPARVRKLLAHDTIEVEAGFLRMQVSIDDVLEVLPAAGETRALPKNVSFQPGPKWNVVQRELNVIGKRAEEACQEVDKFLDSAALASIDRVRIVHGHGMGILKRAVAELLKDHPHVEKFSEAASSEGGAGATIVDLKG
jgi:DNA mismatch repair protein MutS2